MLSGKECPDCHTPLKTCIRNGLAIQVCYSCQGLWLAGKEVRKLGSSNFESFSADLAKNYSKKIVQFKTRLK
ncbi:MAG: zf-TFIIB domain-containing protein [Chitinophagales bacterium]